MSPRKTYITTYVPNYTSHPRFKRSRTYNPSVCPRSLLSSHPRFKRSRTYNPSVCPLSLLSSHPRFKRSRTYNPSVCPLSLLSSHPRFKRSRTYNPSVCPLSLLSYLMNTNTIHSIYCTGPYEVDITWSNGLNMRQFSTDYHHRSRGLLGSYQVMASVAECLNY
jgi:hypothetical protein